MKHTSWSMSLVIMTLLAAGCVSHHWDGIALPETTNIGFSSGLDWVAFEDGDGIWLSPLPDLDSPVRVEVPEDPTTYWTVYPWRPDGAGFLLLSSIYPEPTEAGTETWRGTSTWWLVSTDNPTEQTALCTLPAREYFAIWSLTGSAFVAIGRGGSATLIAADGSGCNELSIPGKVMGAPTIAWSPDGEKIAYVDISNGTDNAEELRILDLSTQQSTTIYAGPEMGNPAWFPGGDTIALFRGGSTIPVVSAAGAGRIGDIEIPGGYEADPTFGYVWSPDHTRLALYLKIIGPDYEPVAIGIVDPETLGITVLEVPYFAEIVGWTPDGTALVILKYEDGNRVLREQELTP